MSIPRFRLALTSINCNRHFSTSWRMAGKQEWIVILPDKPGVLAERMKVRPNHFADLKPNVESGFWVFGGASLDEPIKEGEAPKMNGSIMLGQADTKEEVMEKIKEDVYFKSGVWDESKIQIFPFKSAVREPL